MSLYSLSGAPGRREARGPCPGRLGGGRVRFGVSEPLVLPLLHGGPSACRSPPPTGGAPGAQRWSPGPPARPREPSPFVGPAGWGPHRLVGSWGHTASSSPQSRWFAARPCPPPGFPLPSRPTGHGFCPPPALPPQPAWLGELRSDPEGCKGQLLLAGPPGWFTWAPGGPPWPSRCLPPSLPVLRAPQLREHPREAAESMW